MPIGARAELSRPINFANTPARACSKPRSSTPRSSCSTVTWATSTGAHDVKKAFPERFFNIGIAEANMVGIGAGLASCGYVPILTSLRLFPLV